MPRPGTPAVTTGATPPSGISTELTCSGRKPAVLTLAMLCAATSTRTIASFMPLETALRADIMVPSRPFIGWGGRELEGNLPVLPQPSKRTSSSGWLSIG